MLRHLIVDRFNRSYAALYFVTDDAVNPLVAYPSVQLHYTISAAVTANKMPIYSHFSNNLLWLLLCLIVEHDNFDVKHHRYKIRTAPRKGPSLSLNLEILVACHIRFALFRIGTVRTHRIGTVIIHAANVVLAVRAFIGTLAPFVVITARLRIRSLGNKSCSELNLVFDRLGFKRLAQHIQWTSEKVQHVHCRTKFNEMVVVNLKGFVGRLPGFAIHAGPVDAPDKCICITLAKVETDAYPGFKAILLRNRPVAKNRKRSGPGGS